MRAMIFGLMLSMMSLTIQAESAPPSPPPSAQLCVTCHGVTGQGNETLKAPRLAGLSPTYISDQIHLFQNGQRKDPSMTAMAQTVQGDAIMEVANYFSSQSVAKVAIHKQGDKSHYDNPIETLVYQGDWKGRSLPACVTCHGPSALGGGQFPRLAGQHEFYIKAQLLNWRSGVRKGDADGAMAAVAKKLTDEEVTALAKFFAEIK